MFRQVHGNTSLENTTLNAARCLETFGAHDNVKVFPGAIKPLVRKVRYDAEIHGESGLGGAEGLPPASSKGVKSRIASEKAIDAIARAVQNTWKDGIGSNVVIVSSGPMTNIALFVSVYPELLEGVEELVFMGGGVGIGNRSAVAEFNMLCDPEAVQIVLDAPVKKTMIPLNVTHTAIATREVQIELLSPGCQQSLNDDDLPEAASPLRHTLSTIISFFAETYKSTFGFNLGPPVHDPLTIAYVAKPELFQCRRFRVDVELSGTHTAGETVVDLWGYRHCDHTWGSEGKNCMVAESVNVDEFFRLFHECVASCDLASLSNTKIDKM